MRSFDDDPTLAELLTDAQQTRLEQLLGRICGGPVRLRDEGGEGARPVEFNLETLAWLGGDANAEALAASAELISFVLFFVAKYRLAATLHIDTTEASFAELQRQNDALKASEARYRELSATLQQRVDEQVQTIQQAQQELYENARTRSVGHLAAGVAHEINNPIGFIKSNLKVAADYLTELAGKLPADPETTALMEDFHSLIAESGDGAGRIATIVADLKTFASIDQAEHTLCNINDLLSAAIHMLNTSHGRPLNIDTRLGELPPLQGHPARLSETFFNILDNAARALGDDGTIIVRSAVNASGELIIIIQDNGEGIADTVKPQVFDPFFTTRAVGSGTGLGLTVARDTIRAHQGRIRIDSREAVGTRVTIQLPGTRN